MVYKITNTSSETIPGSITSAFLSDEKFIKISKKLKGKTILLSTEISVINEKELVSKVRLNINFPGNIFHISETGQLTIRFSLGKLKLTGGITNFGSFLVLDGVSIKGFGVKSEGEVILNNSSIKLSKTGGIYSQSSVTINNSEIKKNSSKIGGGITVVKGELTINKSKITKNYCSTGTGGGIYMGQGNITINDSEVSENYAYLSGGIQINLGDVIVFNSKINGNYALSLGDASGGGGITIVAGNVYVDASEINGNHSQAMFSSGIVSILGNVTVNNSEMKDNNCIGPGAFIASNFLSSVSLSRSKFLNNTGASLGGVVNFSETQGQIAISDCEIRNNVITDGQTIGETIGVFVDIIINYLNSVEKDLHLPDFTIKILEIKALLALKQPALNILRPDLMNAVGGAGAATLLKCPVYIYSSIFKNNNFTISDEENTIIGGSILTFMCKVSIGKSIFEGSDGGGIHNIETLVLLGSKVVHNISPGIEERDAVIINSEVKKNELINEGLLVLIDSKVNLVNDGVAIVI